ncbi:MAG TPA: (2Fe-2S) ferredoxin domain-containing protein [Clostridia bacterium]
MLKVKICIGSACHLKGSRQVVEELQYLIDTNNLKDKVELSGEFCMNKCTNEGVNISVNDECFSVKPDQVKQFFTDVIQKRL